MMRIRSTARAAAAAILATLVAGCGGSGAVPAGSATSGAAALRGANSGHRFASWMRQGSTSENLLYTTGHTPSQGDAVYILTYPQGQLVGAIDASAEGLCADTAGNVYLLYRNAATEYAHGGTQPIRTVRIPGAETENCAVDPTTGNLAVTFSCPPCGYQDLAIFPPGSGEATRYQAPLAYGVTYDNLGNLFLDYDTGSGTEMAELPSGGSQFITISLNKGVGAVGSIQWDGKYVTVQNLRPPVTISRISVNGSTGTIVSQSKFGPYMRYASYSWLAGDGTVTFPFARHGDQTNQLGIWKYPKGKYPAHRIKKFGDGGTGFGLVTVSLAPSSLHSRR
ncbi:MAG TPA: hypothetical protein VGI19_13920 [Candidatus Cybelea sp.]